MAKDKISDYSSTANSNTDIAGINIDEGCAPSGINDAIRTLMAQLKNFQQGTGGDSFNGPVGSTTASTGAFTTITTTSTINNLTVGRGAGSVSTNTAVGASALVSNTTGASNTALGYESMYANTTGNFNVAMGRDSLDTNTTGSNNTAIGYSALQANTTASSNTAVGSQAAYSNTTGTSVDAFGSGALYANTTGTNNAGFAAGSLVSNTTGSYNSAFGRDALRNNTTASNNTAVGYQAGYTNSTGTGSVYLGQGAGYSATGSYNTIVGREAGYNVSSGGYNTFLGQSAGYYVTTGAKNTIIGQYNGNQGGLDIRTASNHVVLSDGDGVWSYDASNSVVTLSADEGNSYAASSIRFRTDGSERARIDLDGNLLVACTSFPGAGTSTTGAAFGSSGSVSVQRTAATACYFGRSNDGEVVALYSGTTQRGTISISGATTTYGSVSDYRLKENIVPLTGAVAKVMALKPSTFNFIEFPEQSINGFIAHEVAEVEPIAVTGQKDAVDEEGKQLYQSVDPAKLVPLLTAAIQELNAKVDAQAAEIAALKGQA